LAKAAEKKYCTKLPESSSRIRPPNDTYMERSGKQVRKLSGEDDCVTCASSQYTTKKEKAGISRVHRQDCESPGWEQQDRLDP